VRSERAKIFAPFSPLKGLDEAYRAKERVVIPKAELLCDRIEEINIKLQSLREGSFIKVTYYSAGGYKTKMGRIKSILPNKNMLVMDTDIKFSDIYDIEIL
jgi:hypothetical protein